MRPCTITVSSTAGPGPGPGSWSSLRGNHSCGTEGRTWLKWQQGWLFRAKSLILLLSIFCLLIRCSKNSEFNISQLLLSAIYSLVAQLRIDCPLHRNFCLLRRLSWTSKTSARPWFKPVNQFTFSSLHQKYWCRQISSSSSSLVVLLVIGLTANSRVFGGLSQSPSLNGLWVHLCSPLSLNREGGVVG